MATIFETLYGTKDDDNLAARVELQGDDYVCYMTIFGGDGNDVITENVENWSERSVLYGEGGDDYLSAYYYYANVSLSGGEGNDSIEVVGEQEADGGDGYDKLYSGGRSSTTLDSSRMKNFEELVIGEWTNVGDFDLHSFQKISVMANGVGGGLYFSHRVDLDDYAIETNGQNLTLGGSQEGDKFDLSSYSSAFYVYGGGGNDTIIGGAGAIYAEGGKGNDYLAGGGADDELSGGYNQNTGAYDTVLGLGGDDTINFNSGGGLLDGGEGEDTLYISMRDSQPRSLAKIDLKNIEVVEFFNVTSAIALDDVDFAQVRKFKGDAELIMSRSSVLDDIAILADSTVTIQGTENDDVASFTGSKGRLYFHAEAGDDELRSEGGVAFLWGQDGDDILSGANGVNHFDGGGGNDIIHGGDRADHIVSGTGKDKISTGDANDSIKLAIDGEGDVKTVSAGEGNDKIKAIGSRATSGHGRIDGGGGDDFLYASGDLSGHSVKNIETLQLQGKLTSDADTFDGFDTILAKPSVWSFATEYKLALSSGGTFTWHDGSVVAKAFLTGSDQKDIIDFSAAGNRWNITGGGGGDIIIGTAFFDALKGDAGGDTIDSGAGNDSTFGDAGNDTLYGNAGDDFIEGGNGRDVVDGGDGLDSLYGGNGSDTLIGGYGNDYIYDYSGSNLYIFEKNSGNDHIYGFKTSKSEHDTIDLSEINSIKNFNDMMNHTKGQSNGTYDLVVINLGDNNSITLDNIGKSDLHENMFEF